MYQYGWFRREESIGDNADRLVRAIKPNSGIASGEALRLIDSIEAEALERPWPLNQQMAFTRCELDADVQHTIGTQCAIYLFDPGNGWVRDSRKRADMLIMAAKLIEKNVNLRGMTYYKNTNFESSIEQYIQDLIEQRQDDPPATLNNEILEIFKGAGYFFEQSRIEGPGR